MSDFPKVAPVNKKELFELIRGILQHGWYKMPNTTRYAGTGGPGALLEDLLGLKVGNQDIADSIGWEIKYYTKQTNLITLFHKEAQPANIMRYMVRKHGWKDAQGRMSFRHTISGQSDRFKVVDDANQIIVRPLKGNGPVPFWSHNDLLNIAAGKLRRLVLMKGEKNGQNARFMQADCFETLQLDVFISELTRGNICIDFDAREMKPVSATFFTPLSPCRCSPADSPLFPHRAIASVARPRPLSN